MESIVFFGKGGIGKSTIASNISVVLAAGGEKVLHVGCDPKMDSAVALMGRLIHPFSGGGAGGGAKEEDLRRCVYTSPIRGISCIEAGGPQPGIGCAGTGIGAMLEAMSESRLLEKDGYTAAVFDVLGDVVCGGFAAPLRRGFARKAVIVTSEEIFSLYAANRLLTMLENYSRNGVYLAGLAVNAKDEAGVRTVSQFAAAVNARVLGVIPRDKAVGLAERKHRPVVLAYPRSEAASRLVKLCRAMQAAGPSADKPRPMTDAEFFAFAEGRAPAAAAEVRVPAVRRRTADAASSARSLGFKPAGIEGGQVVLDWSSGAGTFKILAAPASLHREGMIRISDWTACVHPEDPKAVSVPMGELLAALQGLAGLAFKDIAGLISGNEKHAARLGRAVTSWGSLPAEAPLRPEVGFGQWHRFIFPMGYSGVTIPPDSVIVEHGDSECRFSGCDGNALGLFSRSGSPGGPVLPRRSPGVANTDFVAEDAAGNDEEKMRISMKLAAEKAGPDGLVEFYLGCSPIMLADDAQAFAARTSQDTGARVLVENYNSFDEHSPAKTEARAELIARRLRETNTPAEPCDVNLLGGEWDGSSGSALLAARGIKVPGRDVPFYRRIRSAALQVLCGRDVVLEAAFAKAGVRWIRLGVPYGFARTSAWVSAVAAALGKPAAAGSSPEEAAAAAEQASRAGAFRAAFVALPQEIGSLDGAGEDGGVPLLSFMAEAGFGIRLLAFASRGGAEARRAEEQAAGLRLPGAVRPSLEFFDSPKRLAALLRADGRTRLVYSDLSNDARVAAAGKAAFSSRLFAPGYEGALETTRSLLELCEWDFHERYRVS